MNGKRIQAVTFDAGGTLIEPWPSVGHIYAEVATRNGIQKVTADLLQARFQAAWRARKNFNDTRAGWEELVDDVFAGLTTIPPSRTFFAELYERFSRPEAWRVFEDVRPTLNALTGRGLKLGIISNWDERLRELLRQLRLQEYFDTIVISSEVGCAKPEPAIFTRAATLLNSPPAAILHVGDSLEMDVAGAKAAGLQALQIRGDTANGSLKDLSELITIIGLPSAKSDKWA